ncbi:unnamed protein product [Sphagnum troendelagicum]
MDQKSTQGSQPDAPLQLTPAEPTHQRIVRGSARVSAAAIKSSSITLPTAILAMTVVETGVMGCRNRTKKQQSK